MLLACNVISTPESLDDTKNDADRVILVFKPKLVVDQSR